MEPHLHDNPERLPKSENGCRAGSRRPSLAGKLSQPRRDFFVMTVRTSAVAIKKLRELSLAPSQLRRRGTGKIAIGDFGGLVAANAIGVESRRSGGKIGRACAFYCFSRQARERQQGQQQGNRKGSEGGHVSPDNTITERNITLDHGSCGAASFRSRKIFRGAYGSPHRSALAQACLTSGPHWRVNAIGPAWTTARVAAISTDSRSAIAEFNRGPLRVLS